MASELEKLREQLSAAQELIKEQQEMLQQFTTPPFVYGTVINVKPERTTIMKGRGELVEIAAPPAKLKIKAGDTVLLNIETGQIVEVAPPVTLGALHVVSAVVSDTEAEVSGDGSPKIVIFQNDLAPKPKVGDRVVLDGSASVIVKVLEQEHDRYDVVVDTNVTWDDIGGQELAKAEMIEAVESPIVHAAIFKHYNKRPTKGILLYGPPGCGKTMLGKAAATSVAKSITGKQSSAGFMYVKGPELLDPFVGASEAAVRALFARARAYKAKTGVPAVVFIDEADAILGIRGTYNSFMEKTIVPSFLTEMDGMEESGALVILASNRPNALDPAVTRDGRIDRKVRVGRPTKKDAVDIFKLYLSKVPMIDGVEDVALLASEMLYDPAHIYYAVTTDDGATKAFTLANLASGALIAGVVDQAVSIAMRRDLADTTQAKPSGVRAEDVINAIRHIHIQNRDVDHQDALVDFAGNREITKVQRMAHEAAAG